MSLERRKVLAAFGAKLVLTPGAEGMTGAIRAGRRASPRPIPSKCFMPQQFAEPGESRDPRAHDRPEIWDDTDGAIDVLVVRRQDRRHDHRRLALHQARAEARSCRSRSSRRRAPVIAQALAGKPLAPAPHKIQGIGARLRSAAT